jgi:hypothetical protein
MDSNATLRTNTAFGDVRWHVDRQLMTKGSGNPNGMMVQETEQSRFVNPSFNFDERNPNV